MLSVWKSVAKNLCLASKPLLDGAPNLVVQQTRNTVILRRKFPLRLHKKGCKIRKFRHRDYIYEVVDNLNTKPMKPVSIILTQYIAGAGEAGDRLTLKADKAYNEFLLPGLAVYASPENMQKYEKVDKVVKSYSSIHVPATIRKLSRCCLLVRMNIENPWVMEKWHVKTSFRQANFIVPEDAITIPPQEIKGPDLDLQGKEFYVTVTINKCEQVKVRCRLHHDTCDVSNQLELPPDFHKIPGEPIFPEDKEVLDSLPKPAWDDARQSA